MTSIVTAMGDREATVGKLLASKANSCQSSSVSSGLTNTPAIRRLKVHEKGTNPEAQVLGYIV